MRRRRGGRRRLGSGRSGLGSGGGFFFEGLHKHVGSGEERSDKVSHLLEPQLEVSAEGQVPLMQEILICRVAAKGKRSFSTATADL